MACIASKRLSLSATSSMFCSVTRKRFCSAGEAVIHRGNPGTQATLLSRNPCTDLVKLVLIYEPTMITNIFSQGVAVGGGGVKEEDGEGRGKNDHLFLKYRAKDTDTDTKTLADKE